MNILKKCEDFFVGSAILAATTVLFVNIILRYFFSANTSWAEEFIRYAMIWIAFIGSSICFRRGIHVGIDLLINYFSSKGSSLLQIYINLISLIFMFFLIKYGIDLVMFSMNSGQITPSLEIKTFWIYLAIPLGALLSVIHILHQTYLLLKNGKLSEE
ncbi:TRAP transporter small permease [Planococcus sp. CPCC 101016]|uniref:TRAP transporter small permease n=1 Tax=Planococcus sp. CPCC 101016 TaxID=2599617 RepID=UPI0011B6DFA4|nr:TRAP transporter small permease [Planococcus sp. CPCC 101016]TWT06564.1 TRAP transporter small permease [Planococcus sp. CPCC 101016]